jgi:hypothetical protein
MNYTLTTAERVALLAIAKMIYVIGVHVSGDRFRVNGGNAAYRDVEESLFSHPSHELPNA